VQLHAAVRSPCSGSPLSVAIQQTTICGFPARSFQPPGMAVVSSPRIGTRMSTLTRHCPVPLSFRIANLSDGSAASRSPLLLNPSQREIAFSCPFLRRVHGRPPCWTVLRHFLCYSPGAIVSELSVTPSHAIQDCRHSAARLRVVPTVCCITTRLLPLAGSVLPARLYCSAFHEHGQLRHLLLTMFGPSR